MSLGQAYRMNIMESIELFGPFEVIPDHHLGEGPGRPNKWIAPRGLDARCHRRGFAALTCVKAARRGSAMRGAVLEGRGTESAAPVAAQSYPGGARACRIEELRGIVLLLVSESSTREWRRVELQSTRPQEEIMRLSRSHSRGSPG